MMDPSCIFCKIATGKMPASIIYQDDLCVAFLDINPLGAGHCLLIPRTHYVTLLDMPDQTASAICALLPRLGRALLSVSGCDGFSVLQNNGVVAGQVVDHVHFHLIPRKHEDGLGYRWVAGSYGQGEQEAMHRAFTQAMAD